MSKELKTELVAAIRALAEDRGATAEAVRAQPALMTLECVVAEATDHGRTEPDLDVVAGVVILLLRDAANSLAADPREQTVPNYAAAGRIALGIEPGVQGRPLRGKRGQRGRVESLVSWLGYQPATLFKPRQDGASPFDDLLNQLAQYVVNREVEHLVTEKRLAQRARRPPLESAMRVDWLARFERYYAIWSPISGMRFDVELAVENRRRRHEDDFDYFARKALWYYAVFVTELAAFIRERGGLWITPDATAEQRIADAVWLARKPTPITDVDDSVLRLAVSGYKELAVFMRATYADAALRSLTAKWRDWIATCTCANLKRPRKDCEVHQSTTWATTFMKEIDDQWQFLVDWYDAPKPPSVVEPLELAKHPIPHPGEESLDTLP